MINGPMRDELIEFVKRELGLKDDAVITRASFQITDQDDEISIIGSTAVEFQDKSSSSEDEPVILVERKKRGYTKKGTKKESPAIRKATKAERAIEGKGGDITEAQIIGWRGTLSARIRLKLLTKEQIAAMDSMKGTFARNLTPEQKQQIKDIYEATTPGN